MNISKVLKDLPSGFIAELRKADFSKIKIKPKHLLALLSYLNILVIIPMFLVHKDKFIKYHVKQGMALLVVWVVFGFSFFLPILPMVLAFFIAICIVIGFANVLAGKERPLPIIGNMV